MRRFELGIGPLLARLGYVRPDEDPLQSGDAVQPVVVLGDYRFGVGSPAGRVQAAAAYSGVPVGGFGTVMFTPPAGGAWIHRIFGTSDDGSYLTLTTENEVGPVGAFAAIGSSQQAARFDTREPTKPCATILAGQSAAVLGQHRVGPGALLDSPVPIWWYGDPGVSIAANSGRIQIQGTVLNIAIRCAILYEPALEGMRRND